MNAPDEVPNATMRRREFFLRAFLCLFLAITLLLFLFRAVVGLNLPFQGTHAHVSGHFCTMAKTFAKLGVIDLGGVPVENNPPLGKNPPVYLHWPPLFPVTLGMLFKLFGTGEAVARLFVLFLVLANAGLVALLARRMAGLEAGLFAAVAYLLSPVVLRYGQLILHVHFAVFWMLLAFFAFLKSDDSDARAKIWRILAFVAVVFSVASTWEPVLAYAGAFLASLILRQKQNSRRFFLCTLVGAGTAVLILVLYISRYPNLFDRFVHVVLFRAGVVDNYYIDSVKFPLPSIAIILKGYLKQSFSLGTLPIASLAAVFIYGISQIRTLKENRFAPVLAGLLSVWVLWYAGMAAHAFYHDYEMLAAAPVAALCAGLVIRRVLDRFSRVQNETRAFILRFVIAFLAFFFLTAPLSSALKFIDANSRTDSELSVLGREIRRATTEGSVVFTPLSNQVVAYYADRRMMWKIVSDDDLDKTLETAGSEFENAAPFFLAVPRPALADFSRAAASHPRVWESENLSVFDLRK